VQTDLLQAAAVVPAMRQRIDEPRDVRLLRLELDGADLTSIDVQGAGQTVSGSTVELIDPQSLQAGPADPDIEQYLGPEPLIESDAPEIRAEAEKAVAGIDGPRARAEKLTRYVNALLDKKPTVSLPSAREVLRTKVGDCNEHTALYVAMARSIGIPSRIAVGLVYVRGVTGAFYYHAWPEVYIDEGSGRGLWLPVDPTLNEFPADATHLRLARGGLDKQAAILPLIGRLKMTVLDMKLAENSTPILVGRPSDLSPISLDVPKRRTGGCCWWSPSRR
jgi:transglutaminase-like putative cysteine protease